MRIRTANGFGLVRPWSVLVIVLVLVMSGSAAFGQQQQSGQVKSSSKKGVTTPELRILPPILELRIMDYPSYTMPEVLVEGPRNDSPVPNYGLGWNVPMIVLPSPPGSGGNGSGGGLGGLFPGGLPGSGGIGGNGGTSSDPSTPLEARKCTVTCDCSYEINYSGTESSPGCSELQKFNQTLTLTRILVGPCGTPPRDACKGEGTGADYKPDSWSSVTIITLYPGCGQPGIPGSPITDSSRRYEPSPPLVPSRIMDVPVGPHCNGGH